MAQRVTAILGCTASGKSALGLELAERLGGEVVSIDSMAIYRGLDIGTAKPTPEQRARIPHHLIDVLDPWESFDAARFVRLADRAVEEIHARGRPVIAVGGTLMYFKFFYEGLFAGPSADPQIRAEIRARAAREGVEALHAELAVVDPQAAARIHRHDLRRIERALEVYRLTGRPISALQQQWDRQNLRRPDWQWRLIGLRRGREECNRRINERVKAMVAAGLVEEARRLWSDPRGLSPQARQAVGYAELFEHFEGRCGLEEAIERIKVHTRRLARHQRTWLKRFADARWIEASEAGPEWSEVVGRAAELAGGEYRMTNDEYRTDLLT
jgi:tRNA dimethylallyltransferase